MMCNGKKWRMVAWDFVRGLNSNGFEIDAAVAATAGDPLAVLSAIPALANAEGITSDEELPHGSQLADVLDATMGLTRHQAEAAFRLSLFRNGVVTPEAIWQIKTQLLMNRGRPDGRVRADGMTRQIESLDDGECV